MSPAWQVLTALNSYKIGYILYANYANVIKLQEINRTSFDLRNNSKDCLKKL